MTLQFVIQNDTTRTIRCPGQKPSAAAVAVCRPCPCALTHESHPTHNRFVRIRISNAATAVVGLAGRKIARLQSPNIVKSQKHIRCTAQFTSPIESVILVEAAST